jgi:hypothetical protein
MNGGGAPSARRRQPKQQPAAREGGPTPPSRRSESCRAERGSEAGHHGGVTHDQAARNAAQPNPRSRCGWRSTRPAAAAEAADAAAADVCRRPQAWSCCPKPVASEHKTRLSDGYTVSSCADGLGERRVQPPRHAVAWVSECRLPGHATVSPRRSRRSQGTRRSRLPRPSDRSRSSEPSRSMPGRLGSHGRNR